MIGPGKRCSEKAVDQLKPLSEGFCTGQVLLDAVTEGEQLDHGPARVFAS